YEQASALVRLAVQKGHAEHWVGGLLPRSGSPRRVAWSAKAVANDDPAQALVLVLGHDITELERAQQQAVEAERLAAIGQVMTTLAHESRNALQRAQACLERLAWRLHEHPGELDLLRRAQAAQADLTRLFDEVRNYAAPLQLAIAGCNLADVWREAWQQVRAVYPDRDARLTEQVEADVWCSADRYRLGQVFRNIVENAFAACPGPVRVHVFCQETDCAGRPALQVAVRDNGPGFGAGPYERLFEPFYTTKPAGSGLGLAIAKRFVEA